MKALSGKIRELPKCSRHRSAASRIREIMADVEYARSQGVSYKELVRELEKAGFVISVRALESALRRYRKKHGAASGKARPAPAKKSPPPVAATTASARDDAGERILWEKGTLERFDTDTGLVSVMTTETITVSDYRAK